MATERRRRVVIALTEFSAVAPLWEAALGLLDEAPADFVALIVEDERWQQAASLPFTREISRIGGIVAEFTEQRALQLRHAASKRLQQLIRELAAKSRVVPDFAVVAESDTQRLQELLRRGTDVLVVPAHLSSQPIYALLTQLDCRVLLVETPVQGDTDSARR